MIAEIGGKKNALDAAQRLPLQQLADAVITAEAKGRNSLNRLSNTLDKAYGEQHKAQLKENDYYDKWGNNIGTMATTAQALKAATSPRLAVDPTEYISDTLERMSKWRTQKSHIATAAHPEDTRGQDMLRALDAAETFFENRILEERKNGPLLDDDAKLTVKNDFQTMREAVQEIHRYSEAAEAHLKRQGASASTGMAVR